MSKKQLSKNKARPYAPEFRRQMVELVRAGRTPEQLAKEFEPSAQWVKRPPSMRAVTDAALTAKIQPVPDLSRYQALESSNEYRDRMIVNAIAFAFTSLLIFAGICLTMMMSHPLMRDVVGR
jgi:hypothetical protein